MVSHHARVTFDAPALRYSRAAMMRPAVLVSIALACACTETLDPLPPAPAVVTVRVEAVDPLEAWAGARVKVAGEGFGSDPDLVTVQVGRSAPLRPAALGADGKSLEFVVPEDASDGPVSVDAPRGRASGPVPFVMRGLGRLRFGREAGRVGLSPDVDAAAGLPGGGFIALARPVRTQPRVVATVSRFGVVSASPLPVPVALAPTAGGAKIAIARAEIPDVCSEYDCPEGRLVLALFDAAAASSKAPEAGDALVEVAWEVDDAFRLAEDVRLAIAPDGRRALVTYKRTAWFVNLEAKSATESSPPAVATPDLLPVALGGARFLVATGPLLEFADASRDEPWDPAPHLFKATQAPGPLAITAIAAHGNTVAVATLLGTLDTVDTAEWPPLRLRAFDQLLRGTAATVSVGALAFADDGRVLVAAQPGADRLTTFSLHPEAPAVPVGEAVVRGPHRLIADGAVAHVAAAEGIVTVNPRTGQAAARTPLRTGAAFATLHRAVCRDSSDTRAALVVEVPLPAFDRVLRLDATTLEESSCQGPALARDGVLVQLEGAVDGALVLARHDVDDGTTQDRIWRLGADNVAALNGWELPATFDGDHEVIGHEVQVSRDGAYALWRWVAEPEDGADVRSFVSLVNLAKTIESDVTKLPRVEWPGRVHHAGFDGERLVILGDEGGAVYARDAFGTAEPLRTFAWDGHPSWGRIAAGIAGGRAWLAYRDDRLGFLLSASLADGVASPVQELGWNRTAPAGLVTPGGRRVAWLEGDSEGHRLVSIALDPATGLVGARDATLTVPEGAANLFAWPSGERVGLVDRAGDALVVVE